MVEAADISRVRRMHPSGRAARAAFKQTFLYEPRQFPEPHDANFLSDCVSGSAVAYVYEPPPRYAPSSPSVSRADCAGVSPCPLSVAWESAWANAEHDQRAVSSASCAPPCSRLRCRSASPSYDGPSPSGIWRTVRDVPGPRVRVIRCHAGFSRNDGIGSS